MIKGLLGSGSGSASGRSAATAVDTLIGRQTEILGDVRFAGGLHVDGRVKGTVSISGSNPAALSVSDSGVIEGDVRVPVIVLNGTVHGDVHSTERLTLSAKARVVGNVYYKVLQMEPGALINGKLVYVEEESVAALSHDGEDDAATVEAIDLSARPRHA
jgi:cytoskeletal protein CcmA (bactofilin family)